MFYKYNDMSWSFLTCTSLHDSLLHLKFYDLRFLLGPMDLLPNLLLTFLCKNFSTQLVYYFFIGSSLLLSLLFSYRLFSKLNLPKEISILFSLLYSFSIYYVYRVLSFTPSLLFIFFFPLLMEILISEHKTGKYWLSLVLTLLLFTSVYYWFFGIVLVGAFVLFKGIYERSSLRNSVLYLLPSMIFLGLIILLVFGQGLLVNIPLLGHYALPDYNWKTTYIPTVYRKLDEWYYFSLRPWYFIIPPTSSLFFSSVSSELYTRLYNSGWYLAQNYSDTEMAGAYMGIPFILGYGMTLLFLLNKKLRTKFQLDFSDTERSLIYTLSTIFALIFLITLPPIITVKGIDLYTPSYLLYFVVPFFRVLSRWSILLYLLVLLVNALFVSKVYLKIRTVPSKLLFLFAFVLISFISMSVKIPYIDVGSPPKEVSYLATLAPYTRYAVLPDGDYYSIFWMQYHKQLLINPRGYYDFINKQSGDAITKELLSQDILSAALQNHNIQYLVVYTKTGKIDKSYINFIQRLYGPPVFSLPTVEIYKVK